MKKVSHAFTYDHHQSDEGKVWIYTAYIILFTVILISKRKRYGSFGGDSQQQHIIPVHW